MSTPRQVVAVGAHPDDCEYFAGATLAGLARGGADVTLLICSDGALGGATDPGLPGRRREEATRAAAALGARVVFLEHRDGSLEAADPLRRDLVREIRRARPELVLCHDPTTLWAPQGPIARLGHSDHRAAGQATLDALYPRLLLPSFYPELAEAGFAPWFVREVWLFDTAAPDHLVEVGGTLEVKRDALSCHESQNPESLLREANCELEALRARCGRLAEGFRRLALLPPDGGR